MDPPARPRSPHRPLRARRRRALAIVLALALVVVAAWLALRGGDEGGDGPAVYGGLGAWVDVFDYVPAIGRAPVGVPDVDAMAAQGVRTIFLQAAFDSDALPGGIVPEEVVAPLLERAHEHGIDVVGWYAPRFLEPERDLARLVSIARDERGDERFDGIAVDIEDRSLEDVPERNRRLRDLSARLRDALGDDATIAAVVLPTVLLERVNRRFWPGFPWKEIAPYYDVWMPMTYWTDRLRSSGYRDPGRYVGESVRRMRQLTGREDAPVHPIGGIGDRLTEDELSAYVNALDEVGAIGGSLYDYRTTAGGAWGALRGSVPGQR